MDRHVRLRLRDLAGYDSNHLLPRGIGWNHPVPGVPFSATIMAVKPSGTIPAELDLIPLEAAQPQVTPGKFDQLLSQVDSLDTFDNGYDLRIKGDASTIRAQVAELNAAASCCSPLSFNVTESADGVHVRIVNTAATQPAATAKASGCCN